MAAYSLPRRHDGIALARQFAILSLIVISLITAVLCLVIPYYLRKDLLEREWKITADYVYIEAHHYLSASDFAAPDSPVAQEHFQNFYQKTVMIPEIFRVKIYDATAMVVWSNHPQLVGQRFLNNPQLLGALAGQIMVNLEVDRRKPENIYEGQEFPEVVEVYVPMVFPDAQGVVGVIETYKAPTGVFANIRQGQTVVVETAIAGSTLLYLTLFGIVRRAARRLDEQHQTLELQRQELATANQHLQTVQQQLLEAERMAAMGEVVTAVAHGIRNPLANIRAVAQVATLDCQDEAESSPVAKGLAHIMSEVDRLDGRLRELLQFARPAERQSTPVDLHAVLCNALQMLSGRLAGTALRVEEHLAPALPPVKGNAMLFEQAFLSLISNAIEAIPTGGGTITLTTGAQQDAAGILQVFVEVRDTGTGMAAERSARIFEPFYTTKAQGTGLGLTLARKFTEAYGGTITVCSKPGEGTTFRVTLPAHLEP
jgi:two-component system, NtrC family, sensor histidine kinase HydH